MIQRLNELNRLLLVIRSLCDAGPEALVPLESVYRLCGNSVQAGMLPDHELTVAYAHNTGLVLVQQDEIRLTDAGMDFVQLNPSSYYELTHEQRLVLARNHYLGGTYHADCLGALKGFNLSTEQQNLTWSEVDDSALDSPAWVLDHLCQLGVLRRIENGYETTETMSPAAVSFLEEPKGLTEERLRAMLLEKQAIGDIGEKLITRYERARLAAAGAIVESHCVRRIGNIRVNAGYDVDSFDGISATKVFDRFIEVKAAKSKDLHFFWTENEIRVAEKLGEHYWIYFLGGVSAMTGTASQMPLMFQNPLTTILEDANISKTPQGFIVEGKIRGDRA